MTPERYRQINSLADAALEMPEQDRAAYLDQACAGDTALREQVDRLLAAYAPGSRLLDTPLLEVLAQDLAAPHGLDLAGRQIHRYTIISLLGRGGIGEVWLARDARLDRQVALKLLSPRFAGDPYQVRRFQQEARAASALNHPNIVTIYEIAEAEGVEFIAEEFVPGETLRQRLANGPLLPVPLLDIGSQVAAALAAAHQAGIVHRDIKPENIIVRPDGLVKVLDFGLARFLERRAPAPGTSSIVSVTRPGFVLGTARYMSPEQARGLPVGPPSDIFSLGIVLYEMVTGAAPFLGPTPSDVLVAILTHEPPAPSERQPGTPPELERIVQRCLAKESAMRYASAGELQRDLNRLRWRIEVPGEPTPPSDELASVMGPPRLRSRRWFPLALSGVLALLVLLAVFFKVGQRLPPPSLSSMQISRLVTRGEGEVGDAAISPDGKYVAYSLDEESGQSLRVIQLATGSDIQALPPEKPEHRALAFSPDGNYLYYRQRSLGTIPAIYRVPVLGGEPMRIVANSRNFAISPSGRQIAYFRPDFRGHQTMLLAANADGTGEHVIDTRRLPRYFSQIGLAWSPDERRIACFGGDSVNFSADEFRLMEVTVATGAERILSRRAWRWAESIAWPPTGDLLYFDVSDDLDDAFQVWAASPKSGDVSRVTNDLNEYASLGMSLDGKTMLALQTQLSSEIWIVPGGDSSRAVQITAGNVPNLNTMAWTPGGKIVYSARAGDYHNIWVMDADGRNARQLTRGAGSKTEVAVTRDGKYILYQSGGKIWRIDSNGGNPRQLTFAALDVHPAASADSRSVFYASFPDWSPGLGGKPSIWKVPIDGGTAVSITPAIASIPKTSPDGKWVGFMYFPGVDPNYSQQILAIISVSGGPPVKIFDNLPPLAYDLTFSPDSKSLDFGSKNKGVGNLWRQSLDGGPPHQVTHFNIGQTSSLSWSSDGRLAIARGKVTRNVVLMAKFK